LIATLRIVILEFSFDLNASACKSTTNPQPEPAEKTLEYLAKMALLNQSWLTEVLKNISNLNCGWRYGLLKSRTLTWESYYYLSVEVFKGRKRCCKTFESSPAQLIIVRYAVCIKSALGAYFRFLRLMHLGSALMQVISPVSPSYLNLLLYMLNILTLQDGFLS